MCQRTKQMTFWETGVGLWSTAHFVYNSGGSRGGARGARPPLLFLDETEAQRAEKNFLETKPPPPPLSEGLDPPLHHNIATTHLCLQRPCSLCSRKILWYFESQNLRLACGPLADETEYKSSDNLVQALVFRCLVLVHLAFFCCLSFSTFFF